MQYLTTLDELLKKLNLKDYEFYANEYGGTIVTKSENIVDFYQIDFLYENDKIRLTRVITEYKHNKEKFYEYNTGQVEINYLTQLDIYEFVIEDEIFLYYDTIEELLNENELHLCLLN